MVVQLTMSTSTKVGGSCYKRYDVFKAAYDNFYQTHHNCHWSYIIDIHMRPSRSSRRRNGLNSNLHLYEEKTYSWRKKCNEKNSIKTTYILINVFQGNNPRVDWLNVFCHSLVMASAVWFSFFSLNKLMGGV